MEHAVAAGSLATAVTFVLGSMFANLMSNVVSLWYLFAFAACASYISRIGAQQAATNETVDEPAPAAVSDGRSAEV
jgi:hypothetical protein